jgi:bifunctional non-homologous end joining protein LigD
MLATLVKTPFDSEEWLFEIKWDGYRALAFIENSGVKLVSRSALFTSSGRISAGREASDGSWNIRFPEIAEDLKKSVKGAVLDGEIVILDESGKSNFQLLQNYHKNRIGNLCYYLFDILCLDGKDLRDLPLIERKNILKKYVKCCHFSLVKESKYIKERGKALFKKAKQLKLEGIVGKRLDSSYQSRRSPDWIKIKTTMRQEVVIGGFTQPRGSRQKFGALLVGVYDDQGELIYAGNVGGGFSNKLLQEIHQQLIPLIHPDCPFKSIPKPSSPVTWVRPTLVCEVAFTEWTKNSQLRHPIFVGLRVDKKPTQVKKEKTEVAEKTALSLTNESKVYWPKEKITKGDLLDYYRQVAPFLLPYTKKRPLMLHRYPEGILGSNFYQKEINFTPPKWVAVYPVRHEGSLVHYMGINNLRSLLYAVNLSSIDLHPFLSMYDRLDYPDFCLIDLDPEEISFSAVVEAALTVHEILEQYGIKSYCKTSGATGLHIAIPLKGKYTYEQSRQFAEILAHLVHQQLPHLTSLERSPRKRQKKVYLDCLQNRRGQTMAAPYCVRPRPGAPVSTPLLWSEVNDRLDPLAFNMKSILPRLEKLGDLFKPVLGRGVDIKKALNAIKKL